MKFFKRFKSKNDAVEEESFSADIINSWPSKPDENMKVPPLEKLVKESDFSNEAAKVLEWGKAALEEGDEVQYQVPMKSQYGPLTLPALVKRKDGGFLVYYSHCQDWTEDAIAKLLDWTVKLRACDFIHTLKIEICSSPDSLPGKVKEIISKRTEHRMFLNMIPHSSHKELETRARVFAEGFGHFFNDNKILNFDGQSLQLCEEWFKKTMVSIPRDSFYFQIVLNFLGSYFGRVLKDSFGGEWTEGHFPELIISKVVNIRIQPFKIAADFIFKPRLENSPIRNFQLLSQEIKDISKKGL